MFSGPAGISLSGLLELSQSGARPAPGQRWSISSAPLSAIIPSPTQGPGHCLISCSLTLSVCGWLMGWSGERRWPTKEEVDPRVR